MTCGLGVCLKLISTLLERLEWNKAARVRSFVRSFVQKFVSDVKLVNSGQATRADNSATDFCGATVQLESGAGRGTDAESNFTRK